jgi:hypothetical protein
VPDLSGRLIGTTLLLLLPLLTASLQVLLSLAPLLPLPLLVFCSTATVHCDTSIQYTIAVVTFEHCCLLPVCALSCCAYFVWHTMMPAVLLLTDHMNCADIVSILAEFWKLYALSDCSSVGESSTQKVLYVPESFSTSKLLTACRAQPGVSTVRTRQSDLMPVHLEFRQCFVI